MPYKDPEKRKKYQKKYQKEWYEKNKEAHKANAYRIKKEQMKKKYAFVNEYKEKQGCCRCPEADPVCLDFHHEGDKKEKSICEAVRAGWGQERLQKEIDKCVVICANCHRKLHASEKDRRLESYRAL